MDYHDDKDTPRDRADHLEAELEEVNLQLEAARAKLAEQTEKNVDDKRQVAELEAQVDALRAKLNLPPRKETTQKLPLPWFVKFFPTFFGVASIIVGVSIYSGSGTYESELKAFSEASSKITPGAVVGLEGILDVQDEQPSPFQRKPCAAAHTELFIVTQSTKQDSGGHWRTYYEYESFHVERSGPPGLVVKTDAGLVVVPLKNWKPSSYAKPGFSGDVKGRPEHMKVEQATMEAAKKKYNNFNRFSVTETCLPKAQPVFLAGKLEATTTPDGPLSIVAHPELGRVELFPGTRQQLVDVVSAEAHSGRLVGIILIAIGATILAVFWGIWFKFLR